MSAPADSDNIYESAKLLSEYLLFHYGSDQEVLPWDFGPKNALDFAVRSVSKLLDAGLVTEDARALDLGCAVGRSSHVLATVCGDVLGVDYSQSFVNAAATIQRDGSLPYSRKDEGSAETPLRALRPASSEGKRIAFEQGDAMHLRADLGSFDIVHAANLLCRLTAPQLLLDRFPALVKPGGQLLLTTPCTWLEEFTPPAHWPQGSTFDWLQEKLSPHFTLAYREDLPFLIREHARKFQWSVALGTRWVRK